MRSISKYQWKLFQHLKQFGASRGIGKIFKQFLLIAFIIPSSCKTYQPPTPSQPLQKEELIPSTQPDWVLRKPSTPGYYIGVGNAPLADPDYQANAKLEALDDLASEISVTVESSSLLSQVENSAGFQEQFRSAIKSTTDQSIELHEQVDSWSGERYYWLQYRLNQAEFKRLRTERRQEAMDVSATFFQKGLEAEERGKTVQSLHFYAQSIEALRDYINEKNEVMIDGKNTSLAIEAYSRVLQIVSTIKLHSESNAYSFSSGEMTKTIEISAQLKGKPVINLPIRISFNNTETIVTDSEGKIKVTATRKSVNKKLIANSSFHFLSDYPITWTLINRVQTNQIALSFDVSPITMQVVSNEQNLDENINNQILANLLKKLVSNEGYRVVDLAGEYILEVNANTRKGSELSGLHTSYLDISLRIKNSNQEVVFTDSFSNIKGIHTSYVTAGMKAYQNVEEELSEKIAISIQENFTNKE